MAAHTGSSDCEGSESASKRTVRENEGEKGGEPQSFS